MASPEREVVSLDETKATTKKSEENLRQQHGVGQTASYLCCRHFHPRDHAITSRPLLTTSVFCGAATANRKCSYRFCFVVSRLLFDMCFLIHKTLCFLRNLGAWTWGVAWVYERQLEIGRWGLSMGESTGVLEGMGVEDGWMDG